MRSTPKNDMKYKNWAELISAFNGGELEDWIVVMDNDDAYLSWCGEIPDDMTEDQEIAFWDAKFKESRKLWRGGGYRDLVDVLNAVGVPAEWC